jgi:hypothetical protein
MWLSMNNIILKIMINIYVFPQTLSLLITGLNSETARTAP